MHRYPAKAPDKRGAGVLICCLLVAGCTADRPSTPTATSPQTPLPDACPTSAVIAPGSLGIPEREGTGTDATFWALFFASSVEAGHEIKVVWRMTGAGDLTMDATSENGKTLKPAWGPVPHTGGSSFQRSGDEWGTGWIFPTRGCWTVNATRATTGKAEMVIRVA
jgi:hypothetical protein